MKTIEPPIGFFVGISDLLQFMRKVSRGPIDSDVVIHHDEKNPIKEGMIIKKDFYI